MEQAHRHGWRRGEEDVRRGQGHGQEAPSLGPRHGGYSAVLLGIGLSLVFFAFGAGREVAGSPGGTVWLPLTLTAAASLVLFPSMAYYRRAHGIRGRGFATLPAMALYVALFMLTTLVLPALARAMDSWWSFGAACLTLAALTVAPAQLALSRDPNRYSEVTR